MFRTGNFRFGAWHIAGLCAALVLMFGIGMTASGAFAGRLTDQYHPSTNANKSMPRGVSAPISGSTSLVISQLYGGGGNTGAPWQNDFIEVFNLSSAPVSVAGWSVQYASAAGSAWSVTTLSGTIPSGGYYLIGEAAGNSCGGAPCGSPLPTPDITGTITMAQSNGKVALVSSTTALSGVCPTGGNIVDFVGFGTANCFEGHVAIAPSNTASIVRASGGCTDTDDNGNDFQASPTITPRNSASPHNTCQGTPTSTPTAIPTCGPGSDYAIFPSTGATLVPGTTDIGNHCTACTTAITLPFTYNFYGVPKTTANVSNNGNIQFNSASSAFNNSCLPTAAFDGAMMPYWDGLNTTVGITTTIAPGIYTSISGSTPNRIFNIEWRTCVFEGTGTTCNRGLAIFEVKLYESDPTGKFDVVYDTVESGGGFATVGVQRGAGISYSQYSCNTADLSTGLDLLFRPYNCGEVTNTPTNTPTATATHTVAPTSTPTDTPCPGCTNTPTPTATATHPPSNSVVISEFRTRGSNAGNDEFIELYNKTGSAIDIGGWKIDGSSSCGLTVTTRLVITTGLMLPAYSHYLATNSQGYTGTVAGDDTYSTGISDDGGIGLLDANNNVIDAVGMCITTTFHEGTPLTPTTNNVDQSYERYLGGNAGNAVDTNDNASDFFLNASSSNPQNLSSPPVPPCSPGTSPVSIVDFAFNPQAITITQGTTVTWTNTGSAPHTSTSDVSSTEQWDSGSLANGDTFSHTFNRAGTFTYHCSIHTFMTGTVTVLAGCGPTATPTAVPPTNTPTPAGIVNGHLIWQGIAQPDARNNGVTATLSLCNGSSQVYSALLTTNNTGNLTAVTGLPNGTYNWKIKGVINLGNSGSLTISGGTATVDFGTLRAGDSNNSNNVNATDFNIVKNSFGKAPGQVGYDDRANFNRDGAVNSTDFNLLKNNFGQAGASQVCP